MTDQAELDRLDRSLCGELLTVVFACAIMREAVGKHGFSKHH
jgi:hypothetical protein